MALSDIAAGVEVTTRQRDRGVAAVDETDAPLPERLAPFADDLPCSAAAAATVVEAYAAGRSVGDAGRPPVLRPCWPQRRSISSASKCHRSAHRAVR